MNELVERLSNGPQPVEMSLHPERTPATLKETLERGYIHIRFTETRGGTELGIRLDDDETDLSQADLHAPSGVVHLVGTLTLNYVPVRCVADIDLGTYTGTGQLEPTQVL